MGQGQVTAGRVPGRSITGPSQSAAEQTRSSGQERQARGRRIQVRRSGVHGRGVYALGPIAAGERVIEYKGEVIDWPEALRRHPHDPLQPHHTFYFHLDGGWVIDGKHQGNSARWINHACEPNCEAEEADGRVFIHALRDIAPGEELFFDYGLIIDERMTAKLKREYACHCDSAACRGTMLATRRRGRARP
jgi:SET domain-containing protein